MSEISREGDYIAMINIKYIIRGKIMNENNIECNHKYVVGYLFRMPSLFVDRVSCDKCGCMIRLSLPWRINYWLVDIISLIIASYVLTNIHIKLFGSTFFASILLSSLTFLILQQIKRPILRFGKWIEIDK